MPSGLPPVSESTMPWLGAALAIAILAMYLAVRGVELGQAERLVVLLGLCGAVTAAALVVRRSQREVDAVLAEERARPSVDELFAPDATETMTYADGMERWTTSMLELIEHAISSLEADAPERRVLASAAEDARDLRDLLAMDAGAELTINDHARLHALGSLWETGQPRIEQIAGAADPDWYRRWRARRVADRRLRHGVSEVEQRGLDLPYRS